MIKTCIATDQTFNALATMKLQPCTLQAMQRWLHFRGFARIGWVKKVPTSFWHGHLPFWVGGRGSTKDFAFLVAPSFHLSLAVRLQAGLLATKVQNTSPDLHALGAFGRRVTCSPCKGWPFNCTQRKRGDFCNRSAKKPRQALTWWAKASSWKLLTWISVSPC